MKFRQVPFLLRVLWEFVWRFGGREVFALVHRPRELSEEENVTVQVMILMG